MTLWALVPENFLMQGTLGDSPVSGHLAETQSAKASPTVELKNARISIGARDDGLEFGAGNELDEP